MMASSEEYLEFELLGEVFKIKSDVPREYFFSVVNYLKQKLDDMKEKLPNQSNLKLLIFTVLDIIDELNQVKKQGLNKDAVKKLTSLSEHLASVMDDNDIH